MPCDTSYMIANEWEVNASRVACLIDEAKTGVPVNSRSRAWEGYHKAAYGNGTRKQLDELTAELCSLMAHIDPSKCSLELQVWWKQHQRGDIAKQIHEYKGAIYGLQKSLHRNMDDTSPVGQAAALLWQKIDALKIEDAAILGRPVAKGEENE